MGFDREAEINCHREIALFVGSVWTIILSGWFWILAHFECLLLVWWIIFFCFNWSFLHDVLNNHFLFDGVCKVRPALWLVPQSRECCQGGTHVSAHVFTWQHIHLYTCLHMSLHDNIYICIHVCICLYMATCTSIYMSAYVSTWQHILPCNVMIACGVLHGRTHPSRAQISWGN